MRTKQIERAYKKIFELEDTEEEFKKLSVVLKQHEGDLKISPESVSALEKFSEFVDSIEEVHQHQDEMLALARRNLEVSSKELFEKMVQIQAMVSSLGEGYIVFGRDRVCLPIFSKASEQLFGIVPSGQLISTVLKIDEEKIPDFNLWCNHLFDETIDFDDLAILGPKTFEGTSDLFVTLKFKAIRDEAGKISNLILVAREATAEKKALEEARASKKSAETILKIANNRNQFVLMLEESSKLIKTLEEMLALESISTSGLVEIYRLLHTIKGIFLSLSISEISDFIHRTESRFAAYSRVEKVDQKQLKQDLIDFIGDIRKKTEEFLREFANVFGSAQKSTGKVKEVQVKQLYDFTHQIEQLKTLNDVRNVFVDTFCTVPFSDLLKHFDLLIQSVSLKSKKPMAPLEVLGETVNVIPEYYDDLMAALIHVFTNSIAHGIEEPGLRKEVGKDALGKISTKVERVAGDPSKIKLTISDDGHGVDIKKLRIQLAERYKSEKFDAVDDEAVLQNIFRDHFSLQNQVTKIAGRGIGLSALKHSAEKMGGQIRALSRWKLGFTIEIVVPLIAALDAKVSGL